MEIYWIKNFHDKISMTGLIWRFAYDLIVWELTAFVAILPNMIGWVVIWITELTISSLIGSSGSPSTAGLNPSPLQVQSSIISHLSLHLSDERLSVLRLFQTLPLSLPPHRSPSIPLSLSSLASASSSSLSSWTSARSLSCLRLITFHRQANFQRSLMGRPLGSLSI